MSRHRHGRRGGPTLAARAPPGHPLHAGPPVVAVRTRCRSAGRRRCSKTQWCRPRRVSPVVACSTRSLLACSSRDPSATTRSRSVPCSRQLPDGGERGDADEEARLGPVDGAEPGEEPLVEQRVTDHAVRVAAASRRTASTGSQRGAQHVRAQVPDHAVLVLGGDQLDDGQPVARRPSSPRPAARPGPGARRRPATSHRPGTGARCRPSGSGCAGSARRPVHRRTG